MRLTQRVAALLLAGGMVFGLAVAASAQRANRGQRGGAMSTALLQRLNLTADQQTKLKTAGDTYRADLEKARALTDTQARRGAMRTARQNFQTAMDGILTADQKSQLQKLRDEAREYQGLGPMGTQLVALNLTDDQK